MALGSTQPLTEMSTRKYFLGGKGGRCVRLITYQHPVPLLRNLGTLTSWNPLGHSRTVKGLIFIIGRTKQKHCSILGDFTDQPILNPALHDGGDQSTSCIPLTTNQVPLTSGVRAPMPHRGMGGPKSPLDVSENRKIYCVCWDTKPGPKISNSYFEPV